MKRVVVRRVVGLTLSLTMVLAADKCHKGEVKNRHKIGDGYQVLVVSESGKERWIDVNPAEYGHCKIGTSYPQCAGEADSSGYGGAPAPQSSLQPGYKSNRDSQNTNSREVCFTWQIDPAESMQVSYRWGKRSVDIKGLWGKASRCVRANRGDEVSLNVEMRHVTGRSRYRFPHMTCRIVQTTGRGEQIIAVGWPGQGNGCSCLGVVK